MEAVEFEFFGLKKSSSGMASAFSNPSYLKKRCKAFLKKIRKRIDDVVTNDETLRLLLINDIDRLNKEFGQIGERNNNDMEIFAHFFLLIAHLLGWAHSDGNFYRIYEVYKRRQLVKQLLAEGNTYSSVALIMRLTASNVKVLENAQYIDEFYNEMLSRTKKD
jgi:hypothetical protein